MRHFAVFTAIAASLAFGGCAGTNQFGTQLADAALGGVQAVEANPALVPCLASTAAVLASGFLPRGSIRKTNRMTVNVSRRACAALGGQEQPQTAAK